MIKRFNYGNHFDTFACIEEIVPSADKIPFGSVEIKTPAEDSEFPFTWTLKLEEADQIFGLGENVRGINKRGYHFTSFCSDNPQQTPGDESLYGAHNFISFSGSKNFGVFFDYPGKLHFDLCFEKCDTVCVKAQSGDIEIYFITPENSEYKQKSIVSQFRKLIGQSYIPPVWGFGNMQSRWGYVTEKDFETIADNFAKNNVPLDAIFMDIDYMEDFKDFTINKKLFPDFKKFVGKMKERGIRMVPIIDAAVKNQDGYDVCDEGKKLGMFSKTKDGREFIGGVWPGDSLFPDFLNADVRKWFGSKYKVLTDAGIEGFWNDMNEPALFYSKDTLEEKFKEISKINLEKLDVWEFFKFKDLCSGIQNNPEDYKRFVHNATQKDGSTKQVVHYDVHNLYGANMTRASGEALEQLVGKEKYLLFSRASCIGAHRYGGIWTGDNSSHWEHLLMGIHMMPSLNMCGFLYTGTDLGGFGWNATRDLVLRWYAFGIFTPLLRNHSALGTREQEFYQFENPQDFASIIGLRYKLIPYLYQQFTECAKNNKMYFTPLAFEFPEDERAREVEDQLMVGDSLMIAPVYTQNATGRYVYIPEEMTLVRYKDNKVAEQKQVSKGDHYIKVDLNEVVFFVRSGKKVPLCKNVAMNTDQIVYDFDYIG